MGEGLREEGQWVRVFVLGFGARGRGSFWSDGLRLGIGEVDFFLLLLLLVFVLLLFVFVFYLPFFLFLLVLRYDVVFLSWLN